MRLATLSAGRHNGYFLMSNISYINSTDIHGL